MSEKNLEIQVKVNDEIDDKKKIEKDDKKKIKPISSREMFRYASWSDMFLIFIGVISGLANGCTQILSIIIMGDLFAAFNSPNISAAISEKALYFVYVGIGAFVTASLQVMTCTIASERISLRLRETYLKSVLSQEIAFFDIKNSGELASSVAENSLVFREALGDKFGSLFQFVGLFLSGFISGFTREWTLALVILGVAPLLAICGAVMMKIMGDLVTGQLTSYAESGAIAEETISQIRTVAGLTMEKNRINAYQKGLDKAEKTGVKAGNYQGLAIGLTLFIMFSAYGIGFFYGSIIVTRDQIRAAKEYPVSPFAPLFCKVGESIPQNCTQTNTTFLKFESEVDVCNCPLCACGCFAPEMGLYPGIPKTSSWTCANGGAVIITFFSILIGAMSIGQAGPAISAFNSGKSAAATIYAIIDRKPDIYDSAFDNNNTNNNGGSYRNNANTQKKGQILENVKGLITLEDVHFTYISRPDAPIFKGLNLQIPAGKTVALVGESGSGKSTVISLIERFYDPTNGKVTLDGIDIRQLDANWYRTVFGYVGQEPTLFATSIKQNIIWGTQNKVTDSNIEDAAKSANAHDFIAEFPNKYDTLVGGSGSQLSGGQKQRIAIARALIRNPSVLLLDEATSALDNQSERIVQEAIDKMIEKSARTTIVVAHRLSTVKNADIIVVLGKGRVLEQGSHNELMQNNGTYSALVKIGEKKSNTTGGHNSDEDKKNTSTNEEKIMVEISNNQQPQEEDENSDENEPFEKDIVRRLSHASASLIPRVNIGADEQNVLEEALLKDDSKKKKKKSKKDKNGNTTVPVSRAFMFCKDDRLYFIPGIIFAAINGTTFPIFSLIFSRMTDVYFLPNSQQVTIQASYWALGFFGLAIATGLSNAGQISVFGYIGSRMTTRARAATFKAVVRSELGYFDMPENSVGSIVSTLSTDAALVKAAVVDRIAVTIMNVVTICAGLTIAFVASWQVTLVVLSVFPVLVFAAAAQVMVMTGFAINDQSAMADSGQVLSESILGIRTVTALGLKTRVVDLYSSYLSAPMKAAIKKGTTAGLAFGFGQSIPMLANALAFWYGGTLIESGTITFQQLLQSFFGVMLSSVALGQTASMNADIAKGGVAVSSIFSMIDRKSKIDPLSEDGKKPSTVLGDISFENIVFKYPARPLQMIFNGFNLKIQRGQVVALVGSSGSGKSTIVQLLERFYDPDSGVIKFDGIDIRELNINWFRGILGIVGQEPQLFVGTIADNVRSSYPNATDEEVIQALKAANAWDFISKFPDQLDTLCGSKGTQLSGGQKQRIAIARALIKNPSILLLDEATSALDNESEQIVQQALDELMLKQKRTTIIVAHRLSTVRNADCIVVLDRGVVVESGTYSELMSKGGHFSRLYAAQNKQGV